MEGLRRKFDYSLIVFLALLLFFSILGAFMSEWKRMFFCKSLPMSIFCVLFYLLLAASAVYYLILRKFSLSLIFIGAVVLMTGFMFGSCRLNTTIDDRDCKKKFCGGYMDIGIGSSSNLVYDHFGDVELELPFELRLNDSRIEYHAGSNKIKNYVCDVDVVVDGQVAARKEIKVNHPLSYHGYNFYQGSYYADGKKSCVLDVSCNRGSGFVFVGYGVLLLGVFLCAWNPKAGGQTA